MRMRIDKAGQNGGVAEIFMSSVGKLRLDLCAWSDSDDRRVFNRNRPVNDGG